MNGAGGRANGWAGLSGGSGWAVGSSPVATRRFLPGRGLFSLLSGDGGLDLGPQNALRGKSGSSGRGEEESVGKGARGRRMNVRACKRARGGEAGRRLVTQQNARALPPRVRTLCFRAPARFSRDIYGKGGASQLLRDPSRRWLRPASASPVRLVPASPPALPPRVRKPLAV